VGTQIPVVPTEINPWVTQNRYYLFIF